MLTVVVLSNNTKNRDPNYKKIKEAFSIKWKFHVIGGIAQNFGSLFLILFLVDLYLKSCYITCIGKCMNITMYTNKYYKIGKKYKNIYK